jgi:CubicO group peptidase (beta-lactamase class C family)
MKNISTLLITVLLLFLQSCSSLRIPTIYDGDKFGVKDLNIVSSKKCFAYSQDCMPDFKNWAEAKALKKYSSIEEMLKKTNTTSFLVMKDGKLIYENYFNGIKQGENTQIFSATKTITTSLLGIAIQEGKIKSIDQHVSDFIPEFKEGELSKITLFHLVQMQSGLNYDEYKNLLQTLKFYNSKNSFSAIKNLKVINEPGTVFKYKSIDTQILGECIERAVGQPFLQYVNEKLFSKLAFQDPVAWSVDSKESGQPKYYGGLNISARDLAKFGNLILNKGVINNEQILNPYTSTFCKDSECRNKEGKYCNGWWYNTWDESTDVFFGAGFKGQIMMVNNTTGVVIVRLGENKGGLQWYDMMKNLSNLLFDENPINHLQKDDLAKK